MNNKINETEENIGEETRTLTQLVKDAQNRARGFATSTETEILQSHEKMENVTLAREFRKVNMIKLSCPPSLQILIGLVVNRIYELINYLNGFIEISTDIKCLILILFM